MLTPKELRTRRLALGLDPSTIASRVGVPESILMEWEKGERPIEEPERLLTVLTEMEKTHQSA